MRPRLCPSILALALLAIAAPLPAQPGFSFSQQEERERESERMQSEARAARIAEQLSTPCRADLKNRKILLVVGERTPDGIIYAQQESYGPHYDVVSRRLRALGLATYVPTQAEIDTYFRNDPGAALSAAKRLGASFVLSGLITSEAMPNLVMRVNQVSVSMGFTLTGTNGRLISTAGASASSYAGADVNRMALTLVNEQVDEVVATLYADYCSQAGIGAETKSTKSTPAQVPRKNPIP